MTRSSVIHSRAGDGGTLYLSGKWKVDSGKWKNGKWKVCTTSSKVETIHWGDPFANNVRFLHNDRLDVAQKSSYR